MSLTTRTTTNESAFALLQVHAQGELVHDDNGCNADDDDDDGWTGGGTTFSLAVCSARPGVPVTVTMRVVATTRAAARVRAVKLLEMLTEGTEMLHGADYARSGESCRVYFDPMLMRKRIACDDEGRAATAPPLTVAPTFLEMYMDALVRRGALDAERAATLTPQTDREIEPNSNHDFDQTEGADRHRRRRSVFNIEACSMRIGVPVGVNLRVVAENDVEARMRARELLGRLGQGTELFDGADFTRPGESCRVYTDPACMSTRAPLVDEGAGNDR